MIALLRGVTPTGKNRIPKMSYLTEILTDAGFKEVQTYIQSGNILLDTELPLKETADKIHKVIQENIGADLAVILKISLWNILSGEIFSHAVKNAAFA